MKEKKDELEKIAYAGESVKAMVYANGMTANDAAKKAGISPSHLSEVMTGKKNASKNMAAKLDTAFGLPPLTVWSYLLLAENREGWLNKLSLAVDILKKIRKKEARDHA